MNGHGLLRECNLLNDVIRYIDILYSARLTVISTVYLYYLVSNVNTSSMRITSRDITLTIPVEVLQ